MRAGCTWWLLIVALFVIERNGVIVKSCLNWEGHRTFLETLADASTRERVRAAWEAACGPVT